VVLAENKIEHRLQPLLRFAEPHGREHVVELSTKDVVSIMRSLVVMFSAQQPQISTWWKTLTGE
jgi:hypothetical protein